MDPGEAAVIHLALDLRPAAVAIDEWKGRRAALVDEDAPVCDLHFVGDVPRGLRACAQAGADAADALEERVGPLFHALCVQQAMHRALLLRAHLLTEGAVAPGL